MTGRFVFLLALLVSIAAIASGVTNSSVESYAADTRVSHHLIVGGRSPNDKLVVRQRVYKSSSLWFIVQLEKTFYTLSERSRITQVRALDQQTDGKGAYASLLGGGPATNNVTLHFKSQRTHGIDFMVEIYAV